MAAAARGTFATLVLYTGDLAVAARHYRDVFGWVLDTTGPVPSFVNGAERVATAAPVQPGLDVWLPFVAVASVDAAAGESLRHGAAIVEAPTTWPDGSRRAIVTDPQGARVGLCTDAGADVHPLTTDPHAPWWIEALVRDPVAAGTFYGALVGWTFETRALAPHAAYITCRQEGRAVAGMLPIGADWGIEPRWQTIVRVDDLARSVARVRAAGGQEEFGPVEVPGAGSFTSVRDPGGALYVIGRPDTATQPSLGRATDL